MNGRIGLRASAPRGVFAVLGALMITLAMAVSAHAGAVQSWSLVLTNADQVGGPGDVVTYSGTITNDTGAPLAFDAGIDFGMSPESESFTIDFAAPFVGLNLVVPPGGYTGPIFTVAWAPNLQNGAFGVGRLELAGSGALSPSFVSAPFTLGTPGVGPFCARGTGFAGTGSSVAANDSTGRPFIVYGTPTGNLGFASWDGYAWSSTPIATGIGTQAAPSLVMDLDLHPHVAFFDATVGRLVHAWNDGAGWQTETVEAGGVGASPALHVDGLGQLHVSYFDGPHGDLKYARRTGATWAVQVVDTTGTQGAQSSLATDATGQPFIAYFDGTLGNLKLARWTGGAWTTEAVDTTGTVGVAPSLRWREGVLSMSYRNATTGARALKYATGTPGAWAIEVVDGAGDPGARSSLDHNTFGQPRIAYVDAATSQVKFATKTGPAWTREPVASGATASVTMDRSAADEPFLAWTDNGTGEVRFGALSACGTLDAPTAPAQTGGGLALFPSRPNPFAGSTVLAFALARPSIARVRVYDAAGRVVAEPLNRMVDAGPHEVRWNGTGRSGQPLPPGAYIAEVRAGGQTRTTRVVLLR